MERRYFVGALTWVIFTTMVFVGLTAQAFASDNLGLGIRSVTAGKTFPAILLAPNEGLKSLKIRLTDTKTGKKLSLSASKLRAGKRKELLIKHKPGQHNWNAEGVIVWANGKRETFKTSFKTTRVGKLAVSIAPADVDMDTRKLQFRATNPVKQIALKIVGEGGKVLAETEEDYDDNAPGDLVKVDFSSLTTKGDILYMDLKVWDVANFWVAVRITPFTIEIPHDDVVFASGSSAITKTEAPKLRETMKHIRDALAKHGTLLQLKLFVAGYTDTVSDKAYNKNLSAQRARSICAWFRRNGLKIPLYYQGFGESVLAVPTPDNTPEPRNRRALYILSSQTPGTSKQIPKSAWKRL